MLVKSKSITEYDLREGKGKLEMVFEYDSITDSDLQWFKEFAKYINELAKQYNCKLNCYKGTNTLRMVVEGSLDGVSSILYEIQLASAYEAEAEEIPEVS